MNYYKHHIGDYAGATEHLSWDEDLAYTRLLRVYYRDERAIPGDIKAACRLARATTTAQRKAVETVLREFFTLEDDGWHNKRADEELAADQAFIAKQRANGRASAAKRNPNGGSTTVDPNPNGGSTVGQPPTPTPTPTPRVLPPSSQVPCVSASPAHARAMVPDGAAEDADPEALRRWSAHRQRIGMPLAEHEEAAIAETLAAMGSAAAQRLVVATAVGNGWAYLRPTDAPASAVAAVPDSPALQAWADLIASDGARRDSAVQRALDAIGGWLAVRARTPATEPKLRADFCRAYQGAAA